MSDPTRPFASRAGWKLDAALSAFWIDPAGLLCADLGCNVGGFTDCLLRRGARGVYAVDTGYGALAWTLRQDDRVTVMERTNALHLDPPAQVDLVTVDVAWTPQRLIVPAAKAWLAPGGQIISLIKPHYELAKTFEEMGEDEKAIQEYKKVLELKPVQADDPQHQLDAKERLDDLL